MKLVLCDTSANYLFLGEAKCSSSGIDVQAKIFPVNRKRDDWLATAYSTMFPAGTQHDGYALGQGPGSFTALRVSFAFFKTLALLDARNVFLFSSPILWRNFFKLGKEDVFLQRINRTMYYAHYQELNGWKFFSGTLSSIEDELAKYPDGEKKSMNIWSQVFKQRIATPDNFMKNHRILAIEDFTKTDSEISLKINEPFLIESNWQNAMPDYGHELTYITQEQQKKLKL